VTHEFSLFFVNVHQNPHSLSSPHRREYCGDFYVLGCVDANTFFTVCIYRFQNGWDFKGIADSFDSGVSNRGENALLAHDFME